MRRLDLNQRPSGYEPDELPSCSTPRHIFNHSPECLIIISQIYIYGNGDRRVDIACDGKKQHIQNQNKNIILNKYRRIIMAFFMIIRGKIYS